MEDDISAELDAALLTKAVDSIRACARGNIPDAKDIKLRSFEGRVYSVVAHAEFLADFDMTTKTVAGASAQGVENCANASEVQAKTASFIESFSVDPMVTAEMQRVIGDNPARAIQQTVIRIPQQTKRFAVIEPCQACRQTGTMSCRQCRGTGYERCPECHGHREIRTPQSMKQCHRCFGKGRISCDICKTAGTTRCSVCHGQKAATHVTEIVPAGRLSFTLENTHLPQDARQLMKEAGASLLKHVHWHKTDGPVEANIQSSETAGSYAAPDFEDDVPDPPVSPNNASEDNKPVLYYILRVPYAALTFQRGERPFTGHLFGINGKLCNVEPFLDNALRPGFRHIEQAAKDEKESAASLRHAAQFRSLGRLIEGCARFSNKKAFQYVRKSTPYGLSAKPISHAIVHANIALKNLTKASRLKGLSIAVIISLVCMPLYFSAFFRQRAGLDDVPDHLGAMLDFGVVAILSVVGIIVIRNAGSDAIGRFLRTILPKAPAGRVDAKSGMLGMALSGFNGALFFMCLELGRHVDWMLSSGWYMNLLA